jgi:hypothetical protein
MATTTLTAFEAELLPTATPYIPRGQAEQLAGAAYYCRDMIAAGFSFANAQTATLQHARHLRDLVRWGRDGEFSGLTGP